MGHGSFHALDFGLEIELGSGAAWSFIWQQAICADALLAYEGRMRGDQPRDDGSFGIWDITPIPQWQGLRDVPITSVDGAWETPDGAVLCPVTWTLSFANDAWLAITLGTADSDGTFCPSGDDVAVFFDPATARIAGVVLP